MASRPGQNFVWNDRAEGALWRSISLGMESIALSAWRHARNRHVFKNQTGELERSIRIEKRSLGNIGGSREFCVYRLVAGTGRPTAGYEMFGEGRPGGMGTTARGRKVSGPGTRPARGKAYRYRKRSGAGNAYYAVFVELGTRKMRARPFLRPAVISQRAKVRRLMQEISSRLLRGAV